MKEATITFVKDSTTYIAEFDFLATYQQFTEDDPDGDAGETVTRLSFDHIFRHTFNVTGEDIQGEPVYISSEQKWKLKDWVSDFKVEEINEYI